MNIYDVSVIIVNYNTKLLTINCINSIFKYTKNISFEIILVDNASTDGSVEYFRLDNRIIFIENKENIGFGSANNVGMKIARGKYFFFLNSDTYLLGNSIKKLFDFAENNIDMKIGALGTLLIDSENQINKPFLYFPSLHYIHINNLKRFKIKDYFREKVNEIVSNGFSHVECISGADLFVPASVIDIVGRFDPKIFMYADETDLEKRIEQHGFNRIIINVKEIVHLGGGSFEKKMSFYKYTMQQKSLWIYSKKHLKGLEYFIFRCIKILSVFKHLFITYKFNFTTKEKYLAIKQAIFAN